MSVVENLNQERRITFCLYEYWEKLAGGKELPALRDMNREEIDPFKKNLVLIDLRNGQDHPTFQVIGQELQEDLEIDLSNMPVSSVPRRSMLSRITDHYLEVLANRVPIAFEAEFVNKDGEKALYRGILLPFSDDNKKINFILGGVRWILEKDVTLDDSKPTIEELMRSIADGRKGRPKAIEKEKIPANEANEESALIQNDEVGFEEDNIEIEDNQLNVSEANYEEHNADKIDNDESTDLETGEHFENQALSKPPTIEELLAADPTEDYDDLISEDTIDEVSEQENAEELIDAIESIEIEEEAIDESYQLNDTSDPDILELTQEEDVFIDNHTEVEMLTSDDESIPEKFDSDIEQAFDTADTKEENTEENIVVSDFEEILNEPNLTSENTDEDMNVLDLSEGDLNDIDNDNITNYQNAEFKVEADPENDVIPERQEFETNSSPADETTDVNEEGEEESIPDEAFVDDLTLVLEESPLDTGEDNTSLDDLDEAVHELTDETYDEDALDVEDEIESSPEVENTVVTSPKKSTPLTGNIFERIIPVPKTEITSLTRKDFIPEPEAEEALKTEEDSIQEDNISSDDLLLDEVYEEKTSSDEDIKEEQNLQETLVEDNINVEKEETDAVAIDEILLNDAIAADDEFALADKIDHEQNTHDELIIEDYSDEDLTQQEEEANFEVDDIEIVNIENEQSVTSEPESIELSIHEDESDDDNINEASEPDDSSLIIDEFKTDSSDLTDHNIIPSEKELEEINDLLSKEDEEIETIEPEKSMEVNVFPEVDDDDLSIEELMQSIISERKFDLAYQREQQAIEKQQEEIDNDAPTDSMDFEESSPIDDTFETTDDGVIGEIESETTIPETVNTLSDITEESIDQEQVLPEPGEADEVSENLETDEEDIEIEASEDTKESLIEAEISVSAIEQEDMHPNGRIDDNNYTFDTEEEVSEFDTEDDLIATTPLENDEITGPSIEDADDFILDEVAKKEEEIANFSVENDALEVNITTQSSEIDAVDNIEAPLMEEESRLTPATPAADDTIKSSERKRKGSVIERAMAMMVPGFSRPKEEPTEESDLSEIGKTHIIEDIEKVDSTLDESLSSEELVADEDQKQSNISEEDTIKVANEPANNTTDDIVAFLSEGQTTSSHTNEEVLNDDNNSIENEEHEINLLENNETNDNSEDNNSDMEEENIFLDLEEPPFEDNIIQELLSDNKQVNSQEADDLSTSGNEDLIELQKETPEDAPNESIIQETIIENDDIDDISKFEDGLDEEDEDYEPEENELSVAELKSTLKQVTGYIKKEDANHNRSRDSLYNILTAIYEFHEICESSPESYDEIVNEVGLKVQSRAPYTPILKICLGIDYDKTRLTEYAAALGIAKYMDVEVDEFHDFIKNFPGGIKGCVKEMRVIRKHGASGNVMARKTKSVKEARAILRDMAPIASFRLKKVIVGNNVDEFCLLLAKRDGHDINVLKIIDDKFTKLDPIIKRAAFIKGNLNDRK